MNGSKPFWQTTSPVLLAATLIVASANSPATASHNVSHFRDFREQSPDLDRRSARVMFRELRDTTDGGKCRNVVQQNSFNSSMAGAAQSVLGNTGRPHINVEAAGRPFRGQTRQSDVQGNLVRLKSGLDLDLTSSTRNIALGKNLFGSQLFVTIETGNGVKTVGAGSLVSAAEYIAVKQVLSGDGQKLALDKAGRAAGGSVDLNAITGTDDTMRAARYVNAKDVTTIGDFSRRSEFTLLGDLNNFGTVLAEAGALNARAGAISADDINNFRGATISSNVDLSLYASGNLNNAGIIDSTGSLTLSAGASILNTGSVRATSDLNLNANAIRNQGSLESASGNINLSASIVPSAATAGGDVATLEINSRGGSMSALNGAINLREASYSGSGNTFLIGRGNLLSKELNLNSGQGTTWVVANKLKGSVNQSGAAAHVTASTEVLNIGEVCLTGDPTFFNTTGSILINGDVVVSEKLVIAAAGNIESTGPNRLITAGNSSQGFDITLIAGADFKNTGGSNKSQLNPGTITSGAGAIRLTGKSSKTGGAINLIPGTAISSRATTTSGSKDGGNVQLIAFGGKGINGTPAGIIDFDMSSINTGGYGGGKNGNLQIIAGSTSANLGVAIQSGTINTTGGSGSGGSVTMITADPIVDTAGATVTYDQNGNKTSAASLVAADKINKKSGIAVLGTITAPTSVSLTAGAKIRVNNAISGSQTVDLTAGGDIFEALNGIAVQATNLVTVNSGGNIGSDIIPFTVNGPHLEFSAKGFAKIDSTNSGAWLVGGNVSKGDIVITAPNATLSSTSLVAKNIGVQAGNFGTFSQVKGTKIVSLTSNGATNFANSSFGELSAPSLILQTNGSVGTAGTAFVLPTNTTLVYALANSGGNVNLAGSSNKNVEFNNISGGNVKISNSGSTLLSGNSIASGTFSATSTNGTLSVEGDVSSNGAQTYISTGSSGKFTIKSNTALLAASPISILVGNASSTPMPAPANVFVTGVVDLKGFEIKAKKPESTISGAVGRQVSINNGNKNSINFGGDVLISTDN